MIELEDIFRKNVKEILEENKKIKGRKKQKGETTYRRINAPTNMNTLSHNLGFYVNEGDSLQAVCNDINGISRVSLKKADAYAKALGVGTSRLLYSQELEDIFASLFVASRHERMLRRALRSANALYAYLYPKRPYISRYNIDSYLAELNILKGNCCESKLLNRYEFILKGIGINDYESLVNEIRNYIHDLEGRVAILYFFKCETILRLANGYTHLDYAKSEEGIIKMAYFDFGRFAYYLPYYGEDEVGTGAKEILPMNDEKMNANLYIFFSEDDACNILQRFCCENKVLVSFENKNEYYPKNCFWDSEWLENELFDRLKMEYYVGF